MYFEYTRTGVFLRHHHGVGDVQFLKGTKEDATAAEI